MNHSTRDRWILLLLPVVVIGYGYFASVGNPLLKKNVALQKKIAAYGTDAEGLRARIQLTERKLREAEERQAAFQEQVKAEEASGPDAPKWDLTQPAEVRFRQVADQVTRAGLQVLSAQRVKENLPAMGDLTSDLAGFTRWSLHLRGGYPQMQAFLTETAGTGWGIPLTVRLIPADGTGRVSEWEVEILL